jgi:hypothetical protein
MAGPTGTWVLLQGDEGYTNLDALSTLTIYQVSTSEFRILAPGGTLAEPYVTRADALAAIKDYVNGRLFSELD